MGTFCSKHIMFQLENFIGTKCHDTEALRENCPNTEFFLVHIFPQSDWIPRDTNYLSVFSPNAGKYGPEKTPYLDIFHPVKGYAKFRGKLNRGLKNDITKLVNFHASSWKSKNLHFDGLLLSKAYKVLNEIVQESHVLWHWGVIQRKANTWEICKLCMLQ